MAININYSMSKMDLSGNETINASEMRDYVDEKVAKAISVFDTHKDVTGTIVMKTEGINGRKVQKIDITLKVLGQTIHQSAHSRSMKRAVDKAMEPLERQIQKLKTKVIK